MRMHLVSLPHTQVTHEYECCAYSQKVLKFAKILKGLGHTVYLYAGEQNEAPCDELIPCITEKERQAVVGDKHYVLDVSFDENLPYWRSFNLNASAAIAKRAQPKDFLCLIAGWSHKPIADIFPNLMAVEFGIGYKGTFSNYRVFESYAWMHYHYGMKGLEHGRWYDAVIPNYFEREAFPYRSKKEDFYLYVGRQISAKGIEVAAETCKRLGKRLVIAGPGAPISSYGEYVGVLNPEQRGDLMSRAKALFVPTYYVGPFEGVAVEAMMCGTPVITTDWGVFAETVIQDKTGFRCRTLQEFMDAAEHVGELDAQAIRRHAVNNYSLEAIAPKYEAYFERLMALWGDGWYATRSQAEAA